eukprot:357531-Chlamydomonas_euryale.AAC.5
MHCRKVTAPHVSIKPRQPGCKREVEEGRGGGGRCGMHFDEPRQLRGKRQASKKGREGDVGRGGGGGIGEEIPKTEIPETPESALALCKATAAFLTAPLSRRDSCAASSAAASAALLWRSGGAALLRVGRVE